MTPDLVPYRNCQLCPRRCGVDRAAGRRGFCGETADCRLGHVGAHHGEEPCFSGTRGSGTLFFSGCGCGCFFCQNYQLSHEHSGRSCSPEDLLKCCRALARSGVHNLNFVTPDHFWPHVRAVCAALRAEGVGIPFLHNGSGYMLPELVPAVAETMDVFLPDMKFADPALAARCARAPDYPEVALAALRAMVTARGFLDPWDPTGATPARQGVLVRHLVLPGQVDNSLAVLRRLRAEFGPRLPLSVMSQYQPMPACRGQGPFARGLCPEEYHRVCDEVGDLGFEHAYVQDLDDSQAFVPDFQREQPFAGNATPEDRGP